MPLYSRGVTGEARKVGRPLNGGGHSMWRYLIAYYRRVVEFGAVLCRQKGTVANKDVIADT